MSNELRTFALIIYYASFLAFPYIIWYTWRIYRKKRHFIFNLLALLLGLSFIWSRFVEPQLLRTQEITITNTRIYADIVLVSDIHVGAYKGSRYLQRVVNKMNSIEADYNVIAGDFLYKIDPKHVQQILSPLKNLNKPTYFVLGNHDTEVRNIAQMLLKFNLANIEHGVIDMGAYQLAGVGDRWKGADKPTQEQLKLFSNKPTILVAHNPDSANTLKTNNVSLVLSGHTHCGQIRIPYLYSKAIPSDFGHDCGLEMVPIEDGMLPVYITTGVGEIGLPMRLFNPPTIDILHLRP